MEAHQRFMTMLYAAYRDVGDGVSHTQLVRLAGDEIVRLRRLKVPWSWIAARLARVSEKGIEEPIPASWEMVVPPSAYVSATRTAFSRVCRKMAPTSKTQASQPASLPAEPGTTPPPRQASSPPPQTSTRRSSADRGDFSKKKPGGRPVCASNANEPSGQNQDSEPFFGFRQLDGIEIMLATKTGEGGGVVTGRAKAIEAVYCNLMFIKFL